MSSAENALDAGTGLSVLIIRDDDVGNKDDAEGSGIIEIGDPRDIILEEGGDSRPAEGNILVEFGDPRSDDDDGIIILEDGDAPRAPIAVAAPATEFPIEKGEPARPPPPPTLLAGDEPEPPL